MCVSVRKSAVVHMYTEGTGCTGCTGYTWCTGKTAGGVMFGGTRMEMFLSIHLGNRNDNHIEGSRQALKCDVD